MRLPQGMLAELEVLANQRDVALWERARGVSFGAAGGRTHAEAPREPSTDTIDVRAGDVMPVRVGLRNRTPRPIEIQYDYGLLFRYRAVMVRAPGAPRRPPSIDTAAWGPDASVLEYPNPSAVSVTPLSTLTLRPDAELAALQPPVPAPPVGKYLATICAELLTESANAPRGRAMGFVRIRACAPRSVVVRVR